MSSLFGQVWLWSLLSFAAGVALTWLIMVRPAKRQLEEAEDRLLTAPRPTTTTTAITPAPVRDRADDWHVEASRSLTDDVRPPDPPRYDAADLKREELLEELDDEHRPLTDFEEEHDFPELDDDRPRSLFDRSAPQGGDAREPLGAEAGRDSAGRELAGREVPGREVPGRDPAGRGSSAREVSVPSRRGVDEEPELPAEETHLMPAVPVAEVAPRREEPVAPPEVRAFQPREVWREETVVQEVYDQDHLPGRHQEEDDEPERRGSEETALIPATELARAIAEVDRDDPQVWPEHDLTGHFAPVDVEADRHGPATEILRPVSGERSAPPVPEVEPRERRAPEVVAAPEVPPAPRHEAPTGEPRHSDTWPEDGRSGNAWSGDVRAGDARAGDVRAGDDHPTEVRPVEPEPFEPAFVEPTPAEPTPAEPEPFVPTFVEHQTPEPAPKPAAAPEPEPAPKPAPAAKEEPTRPRSLFEPLPTSEAEAEPEPEPSRPAARVGDDQPFVPKLAPELLAATGGDQVTAGSTAGTGLPQRSARRSGDRRASSPASTPAPAPKPAVPPAARPVRPRPVGFSPSTGGRPASSSTRYRGQEEGFNPRSPFGPGSVLPKSDGMAPAPDFQVKATLTGRRYFTSESANFRETRADVWFRTTSDAEKAGFHQAP
ncbi:hypothetical protein [Saccharothrix lopnurensis]|uniref:Uncharacterized protein n=1 Tax=Saccharothrix lopnurensis TaxID=1670621 RepID=A0ABW1P101_9PSEU